MSQAHIVRRLSSALLLSAGAAALVSSFAWFPSPPPPREDVSLIVREDFAAMEPPEVSYDIDRVRAGIDDVPHLFLASLPSDLASAPTPAMRKDMFVAMILPLVLRANEEITANRERLNIVIARVNNGARLSPEDQLWLIAVAERYETEPDDLEELARRIDVVPPSLALAQAAEESGWGTSRFANEGNALFGQRAYGDTEGLTPARAAPGETFRVRAYGDLGDAVRSYIHNLNTHAAYRAFRKERARQRTNEDVDIEGLALADTLVRYSERGTAYVRTLKRLIRSNKLGDFDKARLGDKFETASGKPDV